MRASTAASRYCVQEGVASTNEIAVQDCADGGSDFSTIEAPASRERKPGWRRCSYSALSGALQYTGINFGHVAASFSSCHHPIRYSALRGKSPKLHFTMGDDQSATVAALLARMLRDTRCSGSGGLRTTQAGAV